MNAWLWLLLAAACEVTWAIALKKSENFQRYGWSAVAIVFMLLSFVLLARAMKSLPVGTAYAVWTGLGALGAAIVGILWLGESRDAGRLVSLTLVLAGVVGLKYFTPDTPANADSSSIEK
ncbi:Guanidinium exporter [Planctomycetaceae bacterium]|nr:Guanidinium exporter [Planctomycetaceae bacterium]